MDEDKTVDQQSYDRVDDRIRDFDFDRALKLMQIIEKVTTVSPKNTAFIGLAQAELERMHTEAQEIARDRAEAAKHAEHERMAKEARARRVIEESEAQKAREAQAAEDAEARKPDPPREPNGGRTATVADRNARRV